MQMLQSDWLSHWTLSAISVQWLEVVQEMATFFSFLQSFDANGNDANDDTNENFDANG